MARTITSPLIESTPRLAAASNDPDLIDAVGEYWDSVLDRAAETVRRAQARGHATEEIAPIDAVESLLAPLYFRLLVARRPIHSADIEAVAKRTALMLSP